MDSSNANTASESEPLLPPLSVQRLPEPRERSDAVDETSTISRSRLKLVATTFDFWITGVAVASIGVLIPDIEHYYGTDDATTAFIFPASLIGYLIAAASVEPLRRWVGLRGIAVITPVLRLLATLVIAIGPPFGVLIAIYAVFSLGSGLTDIAWNNWRVALDMTHTASKMSRPNVAQGLLHGSFSLGCILGPIITVAVLQNQAWNVVYLVIACCSCVELILQPLAFRNGSALDKAVLAPLEDQPVTVPSALRVPALYLCAMFFFLYQGIEAAFTDWIVVYMRRVQHMDPSLAGLSSSVFWTGMALGRYLLGPVSDRFGVRISVAVYILVAIVLQMGLGAINNQIASMILLGLNGFMIAPLYPSGVVVLVSQLPLRSQFTAVGLAMALGQMGAAVAPLGVGFMATKLGIQHLIGVVCILSILMLIAWGIFARSDMLLRVSRQ